MCTFAPTVALMEELSLSNLVLTFFSVININIMYMIRKIHEGGRQQSFKGEWAVSECTPHTSIIMKSFAN